MPPSLPLPPFGFAGVADLVGFAGVAELVGFAGVADLIGFAEVADLIGFAGVADLVGFAGVADLIGFAGVVDREETFPFPRVVVETVLLSTPSEVKIPLLPALPSEVLSVSKSLLPL